MGLFRVLFLAAVAVLAFMLFKRMTEAISRREPPSQHDERLGRLVQDPQCGVYVDSREAVRRKVPDGELFFCSEACADAYMAASRQGGKS